MSQKFSFEAFIDGLTGAGLFGKLRRPGAPTEFIDSREPESVDRVTIFGSSSSSASHTLSGQTAAASANGKISLVH